MESNNINKISINIPNYTGPLEVLLDLAKTQKVDLTEISITKLADQFLIYIKENENLNLETASEYLLMATWLAYLKSKLLLPEDEDDDFKAQEVAEKLKLQLKKLLTLFDWCPFKLRAFPKFLSFFKKTFYYWIGLIGF